MEIFSIRTIIFLMLVILGIHYYQSRQEVNLEALTLPLETRILAFGDSLTAGYGVAKEHSYPAVLSTLLHADVYNEGVSGELSEQGLQRLSSLLERYKPHILVLCHGANDILQKKDLQKTKDNLLSMIKMAKAKGIYVLLVGVPTYEILSFETAPFYYEVSKMESLEIEDTALEKILGDDTLKSDRVHPNVLGYRLMAEKVAKLLSEYYHPSASF